MAVDVNVLMPKNDAREHELAPDHPARWQVFRISAGAFMGIDGRKDPDDLHSYYKSDAVTSAAEPIRISLATDGVYAQVLSAHCVVAARQEQKCMAPGTHVQCMLLS